MIVNGTEVLNYPKEKQLYSRDLDNLSEVEIVVKNTKNISQQYSIIAIANGDTISQLSNILIPNQIWDWSLSISGGLTNYSFFLYENTGNIKTLVKKAEKVVCGDVFIIYGQSNGNAYSGVDDYNASNYNDEWIRTAIFSNSNNLEWFKGLERKSRIGSLGLWISKLSSEGQNVPIALINGSEGGKSIDQLGFRNNANPKDKSTFYGNLLSRVCEASSIHSIKGFIWFQGEAETSAGVQSMVQYLGKLETLYANINFDFPSIEKFVVMQINLLSNGVGEAGIIRNHQANFRINDPKVGRLATVGHTFSYDGVHYGREGYESLATMIYKYFDKNVYLKPPNSNYSSPRLQAAVKDLGMNRLRLIFEDNQSVSLEEYMDRHYGRRYINPYIFINGQNNQLIGIESVGNEIRLAIPNLSLADKVTYLPSFFSDANSPGYDGAAIKNAEGFTALTFYNFQIKNSLPNVTYDEVFYREKKLLFKLSPGIAGTCLNCVLQIERKKAESSDFEQRMDVPISSGLMVIDNFDANQTGTQTWNYRLRLESPSAISPKVNFEIKICSDLNIGESPSFDGTLRGKSLEGNTLLNQSISTLYFDKSTVLMPGFKSSIGHSFSIEQKNCENQ